MYRRIFLEIIISFIVAFTVTWFFIKTEEEIGYVKKCPHKEAILRLAEVHNTDKKITKELKEYSLIQIQQGNYEYADVLTILKKKERNDKS